MAEDTGNQQGQQQGQQQSDGGQQQQSQPIAGKYNTPEDAAKGINEIRGKIGLPALADDDALGLANNPAKFEPEYKAMQAILSRGGGQHQTDPGNNQPGGDNPPQGSQPNRDASGRFAQNNTDGGGLNIAPPEISDESSIPEILEAVGVTTDEITEQWSSNGELTAEQYAKFKSANPGFTKTVVDAFIQGQAASAQAAAAQQNQIVTEAQQMTGGETQLNNLIAWARTNITPAELGDAANPQPGTLNHRLKNPNLWRGAVTELMARHQSALGSGKASPLASGTAPAAGGGAAYTRLRDYTKACSEANPSAETKARIAATDAATGGDLTKLL